ncbi:MAG: YlxR family protein [Lachnospiraceae bacterium]|nr:YlxR family protein [Lachnospiraceae bacterium]
MADKKIPMRKCTGCGAQKSKKEMIRVLKTPEGEIKIDKTGRANGRGAYICDSAECLKKARRSGGIAKSLSVAIPDEVYDELIKEMENNGK